MTDVIFRQQIIENDGTICYHILVNNKQRKILLAIFTDPINGNIEWRKIESVLLALGCELIEGNGSRVTFLLNGERIDLHRPHPRKEALRYRIKDVRLFLQRAGVTL